MSEKDEAARKKTQEFIDAHLPDATPDEASALLTAFRNGIPAFVRCTFESTGGGIEIRFTPPSSP